MTKALLLVDIQNDYFSGGKMELIGMEEAAKRAGQVLAWFRERQLSVYHIQHISTRPDASFFLPGTNGVELHESVKPLESELVLQKHYPNSFRGTPLLNKLQTQGIKELVLVGAMSHMCIDATTRAAFDHNFKCTVIEDACATRDLKHGDLHVSAKYVQASFMSALGSVYAQINMCQQFIQ